MSGTDTKQCLKLGQQRVVKPPPKGNVLIIEDHEDTAETICAMLVKEGYGVRQVSNRDNALSVLDRYLYDFIIMDWFMDGVGPVEFLQQVYLRCPRSNVILISASPDTAQAAQDLGIRTWIRKPFDQAMLLHALARSTDI